MSEPNLEQAREIQLEDLHIPWPDTKRVIRERVATLLDTMKREARLEGMEQAAQLCENSEPPESLSVSESATRKRTAMAWGRWWAGQIRMGVKYGKP